MEARNKTVAEWMQDVRRGRLRLPRFQRQEVWTPDRVARFLTAILKQRPLGVFLVLDVDPDNPPFETRPVAGIKPFGEKCREHLLDGQQRLTALLKAFNDLYDKHIFYARYASLGDAPEKVEVLAVPRKGRHASRIGDASLEYAQKWIPIAILAPQYDRVVEVIDWREQAFFEPEDRKGVEAMIEKLRSRFGSARIPYLLLDQSIGQEEAIEIFIETNTSSVKLSHFDLAVAQMEQATEQSLQEYVDDVSQSIPGIKDLEPSNVGDLVLKLECVHQGQKPTLSGYLKLNFQTLKDHREARTEGIRWAVEILHDLKIWNASQLPTAVPLRVVPALMDHLPGDSIEREMAERLIKRYLWGAFLTDRYDRQANDRLKTDYDALVEAFQDLGREPRVPALDASRPDIDDIVHAGWPKTRSRLAKGILAACNQSGAKDLAFGEELKPDSRADFHFIFPTAELRRCERESRLAVNCMSIPAPSNRRLLRMLPGDFLVEIVPGLDGSEPSSEARASLVGALESHLLPAEALVNARAERVDDLAQVYDDFCQARARQIKDRIDILLAHGELPQTDGTEGA